MMRQLYPVIACVSLPLLVSACATKDFVKDVVKEKVGESETRTAAVLNATETLLTNRVEAQERELRDTQNRLGLTRSAVDQVGSLAVDAKARAEAVDVTARDAETRLAHRLATRNNFRLLDTKVVYFDSGQADIRPDAATELEQVATALKGDVNAIVELQSFADPRGTERQNNQLARDRVDAVMRHLVQRHGVEVRQLNAVAMGKEDPAPGEKVTDERLARSRRVEIRLLTPWSSAEDKQTRSAPESTHVRSTPSDEGGAASPATTVDRDPAGARPLVDQDARPDAPWREIIKSILPRDLGARDWPRDLGARD